MRELPLCLLTDQKWTVTETAVQLLCSDHFLLRHNFFFLFHSMHYQFSLCDGYRHTNNHDHNDHSVSAWTKVFIPSELMDIFSQLTFGLVMEGKSTDVINFSLIMSFTVIYSGTVRQHAQYPEVYMKHHPLFCVVLKLLLSEETCKLQDISVISVQYESLV